MVKKGQAFLDLLALHDQYPGKMLLSWAFSLSALILVPASETPLCTIQNGSSAINTLYTSSALESLSCHNDYQSYISCSWTASQQGHSQTPLSLFNWYRDSESEFQESQCVPYPPSDPLPDGRVAVHCKLDTGIFAFGKKDAYFFKTPCPRGLEQKITPLQHVRLGPPRDLSQQTAEGGAAVLEWQEPPYATRLHPGTSLSYQVGYRRRGQEWTEVEVSALQLNIEAESLVSGCEYEAKVRVRADTGRWSEWSPTVVWKAVNVPGPANLQCVFDGQAEMHCSWEVKRELTEVFTYRLSYRLSKSSPAQWCNRSSLLDAEHSAGPALRFSCSFSVSDPGQELEVELLPTYNTKLILSHSHVKPSPPALHVTERDQDWVLSWTLPKTFSSKIPLSYQLRYWSRDKQENMTDLDLAKGTQTSVIYGSSLRPCTNYTAQVRALASYPYSGPPSDWSEEIEWTTGPAPWSIPIVIYVVIGVLHAIIFISIYFTLTTCRRRIVLWKESLPTPIKSKVLEEIIKTSPSTKPSLQKDLDKTLICSIQVLGKVIPSCYVEDCSHPLEKANGNGPGPCWETLSKASELGPAGPPQQGSFSFSGPYILCSSCSFSEDRDTDGRSSLKDFLLDTSQIPPPSPLCQSNMGYGAQDSVQGPAQESGPKGDGYVADSNVQISVPLPKGTDWAPPAYTSTPGPFPGDPGEFGGRDPGSLPSVVPWYPAGGGGSGWPDGQCGVSAYIRFSKTIQN